jgi:hypothetical protein
VGRNDDDSNAHSLIDRSAVQSEDCLSPNLEGLNDQRLDVIISTTEQSSKSQENIHSGEEAMSSVQAVAVKKEPKVSLRRRGVIPMIKEPVTQEQPLRATSSSPSSPSSSPSALKGVLKTKSMERAPFDESYSVHDVPGRAMQNPRLSISAPPPRMSMHNPKLVNSSSSSSSRSLSRSEQKTSRFHLLYENHCT